MGDEASTPPAGDPNLQFDKAEFNEAPPGKPACQTCQKEISGTYFEINGSMACPACKERVEEALKSGSPARRFIMASLAGTFAAGVGCGIYYAIVKWTGMEFGLVAVIVGLMVGGAVRWGSEGRGGRAYQLLAVFLTYNAIVLTYLPFIFEGLKDGDLLSKDKGAAVTQKAEGLSTPGPEATLSATPAVETPSPSTETPSPSAPTTTAGAPPPEEKMTAGKFIIGVLAIFLIAYLAPFLAGFQNIIGLLIIGFALYEAWKINSKPSILITGPYQMGSSPIPPPAT